VYPDVQKNFISTDDKLFCAYPFSCHSSLFSVLFSFR
jgi:hypothetical protein